LLNVPFSRAFYTIYLYLFEQSDLYMTYMFHTLLAVVLLLQRSALGVVRRAPSSVPVQEDSNSSSQRIAFAAFVTGLQGAAWEDAAAVMAHGIHEAARRSRHKIEAVALAPDSLPVSVENTLKAVGFDRVIKRPVPFQLEEIQDERTRREMAHVQGQGSKGSSFSLLEECIKYQAIGLTEYDRVLVLDLDTIILDPMDAIMDAKEDLVGTYDVAMEGGGRNVVPVVQGGFLLVRTNITDLEEIKRTSREGKFGGSGWENSHIGYAYGGVGPQGMMSYHYHKDWELVVNQAPGYRDPHPAEKERLFREFDPAYKTATSVPGKRFLALDRRAYDVIDTPFTSAGLKNEDKKTIMARLRSAHFTGGCAKPWVCTHRPQTLLCEGMTEAWWSLRTSLAASWGVEDTPHCKQGGTYIPLSRPTKL
jgi:hypothetical protein